MDIDIEKGNTSKSASKNGRHQMRVWIGKVAAELDADDRPNGNASDVRTITSALLTPGTLTRTPQLLQRIVRRGPSQSF
jgi:hypothetical protein